jgi:hypothetical protein
MAGASSGVEVPSDSPIQRQLKERVQLGDDEAATAIRPRPWTAGLIKTQWGLRGSTKAAIRQNRR